MRILKPDGSFDATFNTADARLSHVPLGLAEQTDGKLIVVGSFTTYGGVTIGKHMRLNADGTLDGTYCSGRRIEDTFPFRNCAKRKKRKSRGFCVFVAMHSVVHPAACSVLQRRRLWRLGNITTVSYDPRGFAYYTPSSISSSVTFQTSGKKGTVRVFAGQAPLAILNQSSGFAGTGQRRRCMSLPTAPRR